MTSPYIVLSGLGVAAIPCSGHVPRTPGQPGGSAPERRSLVVINSPVSIALNVLLDFDGSLPLGQERQLGLVGGSRHGTSPLTRTATMVVGAVVSSKQERRSGL